MKFTNSVNREEDLGDDQGLNFLGIFTEGHRRSSHGTGDGISTEGMGA